MNTTSTTATRSSGCRPDEICGRTRHGTLRGLHFQREGALEGKLLRCLRGRVFDVAEDLRRTSPTFAGWHAVELSAENARQVWIPPGFAHGFQTLSDDAECSRWCRHWFWGRSRW